MASIEIIKSIHWINDPQTPMIVRVPTWGQTNGRSPGAHDMLGIGQRFPDFSLTGVVSNDPGAAFQTLTQDSFPGKWKVVFFWPKDFTFVCPTEIAAFGGLEKEFQARDAQVLGISIDSEYVHLAWRREKD